MRLVLLTSEILLGAAKAILKGGNGHPSACQAFHRSEPWDLYPDTHRPWAIPSQQCLRAIDLALCLALLAESADRQLGSELGWQLRPENVELRARVARCRRRWCREARRGNSHK